MLETADVQLIISASECFPVNLLGAKLHGVPVVLYEPPFFESIVDKKGLIPVPQHSVRGAADAIIELLLKDCTQQVFPVAAFKGSDYPSDNPLLYKESSYVPVCQLSKGIYLFKQKFHFLIRLLKAIRRITDQDSFKGTGLK
ncbi:hypothetical protein [Parasutterella excrementihominis]|uniref:hypothetical protein n=1 Tax=Parasutterella excrementihominis TaxID=487175 RepID=UPI0026653392|nr:hypothetical protein [Parasutterella excrementihominis]